MKSEEFISLAYACGFDAAKYMEPGKLLFLTEVRDMCAANKCGCYGKSWSCPPACGPLSEIEKKCSNYKNGLLLQTVLSMEDENDISTMFGSGSRHNKNFIRLIRVLRERKLDIFPMGAGCCRICEECAYPEKPCRFPSLGVLSMEACGLLVSRVCEENGMQYYYGPELIAMTSCCLYN